MLKLIVCLESRCAFAIQYMYKFLPINEKKNGTVEKSFETPSLAEPKKAVAPAATLLPKAPMLAAGPVVEGLVFDAPAAAPTPAPAAPAASLAPGVGVGLEAGPVAPGDAGPRFTLLLMKPIGLLNMLDIAASAMVSISA